MSKLQDVTRVRQLVDDVATDHSAADLDPFASEPKMNKPLPEYLPTPQQIRDECRRIREGWSEDEHWKRAGYPGGKPSWELQRHPTFRTDSRSMSESGAS